MTQGKPTTRDRAEVLIKAAMTALDEAGLLPSGRVICSGVTSESPFYADFPIVVEAFG